MWPNVDPEKPVAKGLQSINASDCCRENHATPGFCADQPEVHASELVDAGEEYAVPDKSNLRLTPHWKRGSMANLFKAYMGDEDKYDRSTKDNFERNFKMFLERCEQANIPCFDRHRAISIMLVDQALQYYRNVMKTKNPSLVELKTAAEFRFQSSKRTRALLRV